MKKLIIPVALSILSLTAYSQAWMKGGNNPSGSPFSLGSNTNDPINFITNGTQRMLINNGGTGANDGQIAVGNNLPVGFIPSARFHIHQDGRPEFIRFTNNNTGTTNTSGFAIGFQTNGGQVAFRQNSNEAITWEIDNGAGTLIEFMRMNNGTGFVGMGTNSLASTFQLGVDDDININTNYAANTNNQLGFRINGEKVLNNFGDFNIFVGVDAGLNNAFSANQNTFVGFSAGKANTTGIRNTFIGANAGENVQQSNFNTFIGTDAGKMFQLGDHNTFVGEESGDRQIEGRNNSYFGAHAAQGSPPTPGTGKGNDNTILGAFAGADFTNGNGNTFTGTSAGRNCTDGSRNVMSGFGSGFRTTTGDLNVFSGFGSGQFNVTGSQNIFIGANSGPSNITFGALTNAIAIGFTAHVRNNNHMILGNNQIYVGIGLSDDIVQGGPQNKLEINSALTSHTANDPLVPGSITGTTGASGLRFRDLRVGSTALTTNPHAIPAVLTVDAKGDVVLVNDGGSSLGNICGATTTNPLADNWEIPLNNKNFVFSNPDAGTGKVGIGDIATACTPANTLEIGAVNNGESGLTFTKLTNASPASGTNNGKILSVDASGKVILVPDLQGSGTFAGSQNGLNSVVNANNPTGKVELGQTFGQGANPAQLLSDREIPLGGKKLWLNNASGGNFIVGLANNSIASQQNSIFGNSNTIGTFGSNFIAGNSNATNNNNIKVIGSFNSLNGSGDIAIGNGNTIGATNTGNNNAVLGATNTIEGDLNQIVGYNSKIVKDPLNNLMPYQSSSFGTSNITYGGNAVAIGTKVVTPPLGVAVLSIGSSNGNAAGAVEAYFTNNAGGGNSVIFNAHIPPSPLAGTDFIPAINIVDNKIAVKKYFPQVALDVNGSIYMNGVIVLTSDSTLKTNIQPLNSNAIQKIKQFRPVTYEWITKADTGMYGTQYGFTAQQIETVMPDLVKTGIDGIKTLNYNGIIPLLVKSVQEQQSTIDSMRTMMNQMASMLNSCCQNTSSRTQTTTNISAIDVELSDKDIVVLNQNVPNPFAEQTTITYNIPDKSGFAQIIFNDMKGQIIKVIDVKSKGKGQLNVFANDLSTGMYTYSLYVDGKLVDTKKMVKTE